MMIKSVAVYIAVASLAWALSQTEAESLLFDLPVFANRSDLLLSQAWASATAQISSPQSNHAFYIENDDTILTVVGGHQRRSLFSPKWAKSSSKDIECIEFSLGKNQQSVGSTYFPLVTVSAEFSTSPVKIEREVTHGKSLSYSSSVAAGVSIIQASFKLSLDQGVGLTFSKKEMVACTANPGGRVQLQVSNRMLHFPEARARKILYLAKNAEFSEAEWESLETEVADEHYLGAIFHEKYRVGRMCYQFHALRGRQ